MTYTTKCEECDGRGIDPGNLSESNPEQCLACGGAGTTIHQIEIGDVIEFSDDETRALRLATVLEVAEPGNDQKPYPGWIRVHVEGTTHDATSPDYDEPDIHVSLVVRVVEWQEYLDRIDDERKAA